MRFLSVVLIIFLVSCSEKEPVLTNQISINQGTLYGYENSDVNVYEGIPYAASPIND